MDRTNPNPAAALRRLPSVDAFLQGEALSTVPRSLALRVAREFLDRVRGDVLSGTISAEDVDELFASDRAVQLVLGRCASEERRRHRRVINATGIVLHTGIGRAPLPAAARAAIVDAAGYAVVEVDPDSGERNQREEAVAAMLTGLCGTSGALVVNNNAAMVNLVLRALGEAREVVVSRGEQVEIGGGFRMPDVMAQAGCRMVEVGATNRTHLRDYEQAITEHTSMLLKIHTSNYRIVGFHSAPSLAELVELGARRDVLVFEDLGSGLLIDDSLPGLESEPRVRDSVAAGVPLISFSGDKLLGGPQCGILIGDADLCAQVRAHPLYRAFRCDKLTLAALEATLRVYRDSDPVAEIPSLYMLSRPQAELREAAVRLCSQLESFDAEVVDSESFAGSGANPARALPSCAVAIPGGDELAAKLRAHGVWARIADDRVLFDQRTLVIEDPDEVSRAIRGALVG